MEWLYAWDIQVLEGLRAACASPAMDRLMTITSTLGNAGMLWIALGILFLLLGIRRKEWRSLGLSLLLCIGAGAVVCNLLLKPWVNRMRPYDLLGYDIIVPPLGDPSFPSGHTTACFAAATAIYARNRAWGLAAYAFGVLMGFSRIYLGVHFPTDVLAGAIVGTASAAVVLRLQRHWRRPPARRV